MQSRWQIELFGWLRAVLENDRVVTRFRSQQTAELLAYLASLPAPIASSPRGPGRAAMARV